jgi:hypothetical protein
MSENLKEVRFDIYCEKCKHKDLPENEDPCWDCLTEPVNESSKKPVYFVERGKDES